MLPSGVQAQPPRQPSEAAYGSSGRPREVGAILRRTPTFVTITAQLSPPVRRERASPRATARRRRQAVTRREARPLKSRPRGMSVYLEKRHRVRVREHRA